MHCKLLIALCLISFVAAQQQPYLWPLPQSVNFGSQVVAVNPDGFQFTCASGSSCSSVLTRAFERYKRYIFFAAASKNQNVAAGISGVTVNAKAEVPLEYGVDESYTITVTATAANIVANTEWGALRALETFSQLIDWDSTADTYSIDVVPVTISDYPRFGWRGLLIDTARHYEPLSQIRKALDAMSFNKMNVLHWHIVDDQSFPFDSVTYPLLSEKGAWVPNAIYTHGDIKHVIEYARERGIRVVPEFDSPGHSYSWSLGYPELFPDCDYKNVFNPTTNYTTTFVKNFFAEVADVYNDAFLHFGGDEVTYDCWQQDASITQWMKQHGITSYADLQGYYEAQIETLATKTLNKYPIFWQEVFDKNNGTLQFNTSVVNVWLDGPSKIQEVVQNGYRAVYSSPWYLDREIPDADETFYLWEDTWMAFYDQDPVAGLNLTPAQLARVLGGEASMWGEQVDFQVFDGRVWPRAGAIAERLWSASTVVGHDQATPRLGNQRCRMVRRGIQASPIYPDYCELGQGFEHY